MRPPYGIFATLDGRIQFLRKTSVRFSRANWAALQDRGIYPGVFFAHFEESQPITPKGERFTPTPHLRAPTETLAERQQKLRRQVAENLNGRKL